MRLKIAAFAVVFGVSAPLLAVTEVAAQCPSRSMMPNGQAAPMYPVPTNGVIYYQFATNFPTGSDRAAAESALARWATANGSNNPSGVTFSSSTPPSGAFVITIQTGPALSGQPPNQQNNPAISFISGNTQTIELNLSNQGGTFFDSTPPNGQDYLGCCRSLKTDQGCSPKIDQG